MKYLMARDAGVKAAEYVIQKWPELFPSRDFSPVCRYELLIKVLYLLFCRILNRGIQSKNLLKILWNVCGCRVIGNFCELLILQGG